VRQGITSISGNADALPLHLIQVVPGTGTE
jgi:hypothetical protein